MDKFIFFDLDDCMVESSPLIQESINNNTDFKSDRLMAMECIIANCKDALERNTIEIERAVLNNERPRLVGNIKIGSNDVMKTSSGNQQLDDLERDLRRQYRWYKLPLELSKMAYEEAVRQKEMFLEERDHLLESDNLHRDEDGLINYKDTYTVQHTVNGALELINDCIENATYGKVYVLSHHNGGREEYYKRMFVEQVSQGKLEFLGLRFHLDTYKEGVRRPRSSKALHVMQTFGLSDLSNCILVDDSTANLDEWVKYGGVAVLYRPISEDEEYEGRLVPHGNNYPRITKMDKEQLEKALAFYMNNTNNKTNVLKI